MDEHPPVAVEVATVVEFVPVGVGLVDVGDEVQGLTVLERGVLELVDAEHHLIGKFLIMNVVLAGVGAAEVVFQQVIDAVQVRLVGVVADDIEVASVGVEEEAVIVQLRTVFAEQFFRQFVASDGNGVRSFEGGIGDNLILPLEQFFKVGFQHGGGVRFGGGTVLRHQNHVVVIFVGENYRLLCQCIKNCKKDAEEGNGYLFHTGAKINISLQSLAY